MSALARAALGAAILIAVPTAAAAQPAPFDMSHEGAAERPAPAAAPSQPARAAPAPSATAAPGPAAVVPQGAADRRYIVPMERLTLGGETASRRWAVFLSGRDVAQARSLRIGYQSSIFVAPEASRLRLVVNGQAVIDTPVQSPDTVAHIEVEVPAGLLEPGLNTIAFEAQLRHRTDCTIESTYDLWAEVQGAESFIALDAATDSGAPALEDLRAVGFDAAGRTRVNIVVPQGRLAQAAEAGVRLSQGLVLLGASSNASLRFFEDLAEAAAGPGELTAILGPAEEIRVLVPSLPQDALRGPFAGFVELASGASGLVVSGPSWQDVEAAVEEVAAPVDRPMSVNRSRLSEPGLRNPDPPLLFAAASVPLRDLGVPTQEFSGRLFRTHFAVGVPSDFYASSYGEATILLDAAYSDAVRPGSRIDVYVNGDIATTLPIGSSSGAVLRQYPVPVTLRHFRPGANLIAIEAVLDTESDAVCLPGTSTGSDTRFALFDSSSFEMPDFARIGQRPGLTALAGVGSPYNRIDGTIPLVLAENSTDTLSAAATMAARIALVAGRPLDYEIVSPAGASGRDALFIGPAPRLPAGILPQVGVSDSIRAGWSEGEAAASGPATDVSIARWQEEVGGRWRRPFIALEGWLETRFDLSMDALRLTRAPEQDYTPPSTVPLLVAQGRDPSDEHIWTVVTGRTGAELRDGVTRLADEESWSQLSGRLTAYDSAQALYVQLPATDARLVPSVPTTLANMRLVAANWLSANALAYALILAIASIVLGATTGALTGILGRRR